MLYEIDSGLIGVAKQNHYFRLFYQFYTVFRVL